MTRIRLTKEFKFEMSHALKGYDGLCKNIHGHSYKLRVTIIGEPLNNQNHPKNGMVMDFGDLKRIVNREIIDVYDHTVVISNSESDAVKEGIGKATERIIFSPYQPTCENLIDDFAEKISKHLPDNISLYSLRLDETASSYAEWYASDNV
jgi:6-pyruvoyltetrahydropterin/6-carboxytetrahydropterin synthase